MPIDPKLLTKAAKVYEAAESVEGGKPKEVYESHKQCTPGEFGMNKEGGMFAKFVRKTAADIMRQRDVDAGVNAYEDAQHAGYAEQVPQNYLDTRDVYKNIDPKSTYRATLDGTEAGGDYERFQHANRMGIGGSDATDILVNRMRHGDEKAYRYSDGYTAPLGASSDKLPQLQYQERRPAKPMPPRGTGHGQPPKPMPAAPKPAPAPLNKITFNKKSAGNENWKGFDYSKVGPGGLIGSRTLPKSDATAKNWQGTKGTPQKPGTATTPADQKNPPMKPVPQPMMKKISAFAFGQLVAQARN